jgi:predicted small lipoprotein YifL
LTFKPSSAAILTAASILLTACGQRGPLYFPDQPPPKKRLSQSSPPGAPELLAASSTLPAAASPTPVVRQRQPASALS